MTERTINHYGWTPDLPDHRDRIFNLEERVLQAPRLPLTADLASRMPPIRNQLQVGRCTGFGIARTLGHQAIVQSEPVTVFSPDFIYFNEQEVEGTVGQDSGAKIRDGIKVVASVGCCAEADMPLSDTLVTAKPSASVYAAAAKHEAIVYQRIIPGGRGAPIRTALALGRPVVFGFSVPISFEDGSWDPASDPLPLPGSGEGFIGGHCVVLTGYDFSRKRWPVNALQADNSWDIGFGMGGRFWFDAAWFDPANGLTSDMWVITRVS